MYGIPFFILVILQQSVTVSKQQARNYNFNYIHYFKIL